MPVPIVMLRGTITGVAGGVIRDVLCAAVPLILRREIYATAAIAGAAVFVLITALGLAALRLDLHVPSPRQKNGSKQE